MLSVRGAIVRYPEGKPFDFHGVPQQALSVPSGMVIATPARSHNARNASETDIPVPSGVPNMLDTQAGKNTAVAASSLWAGRARPPPGSRSWYWGTCSEPRTARPTLVTARGSAGGNAFATLSPTPATRVVVPHTEAAAPQTLSATTEWFSSRRRRTRSPVLMFTGHAVAHMPSTAQVCKPS